MDAINYLHKNNEKSHKQIQLMIEQLDLIDRYREWHPHMKRYTWRGPRQKQARLDYFLISSNLQTLIPESDIGVAYMSDHSPVYLLFQMNEHVRDKGTWKFSNFLLRDEEYIKIVKECISETINQYKIENNENILDVQLFWEILKTMLRGKSISYSSFKEMERDKIESDIESKLNTLFNMYSQNKDDIIKLESELKKYKGRKI
jgi:hypothetical protein